MTISSSFRACVLGVSLVTAVDSTGVGHEAGSSSHDAFDHTYQIYSAILRAHVRGSAVDYAALKDERSRLDRATVEFDAPSARAEATWTREQRLAFWINAYNAFTLQAIVDHYPIRAGWFTLAPRNSIRQIDGVWTKLSWPAAGRRVTLDDIEHRILRPVFSDPRIHFAVNCASVSCPPLLAEPYRSESLEAQLDAAARRYLASPEGVRLDGDVFRVSSIFKWYGEDFVEHYASTVAGTRSITERAILGVLARFAPEPIARKARTGRGDVRFLDYNWSLNDTRLRALGDAVSRP